MRGFLAIIEDPSADKKLVEIARRCLERNLTYVAQDKVTGYSSACH
ncbi:MAG: hypothetical protein ABIR26_05420 [Ramlibacter sp.]